jgi:serine/threonine-protein kinase
VGKDGISRLTDFGVARAEARIASTSSGRLKGKMAYMPPEQILGEPVDRRSDLYAAAIVLWELLTGKRLFRAESEGELVHKILSGNPTWPHKIASQVPLAVSSVCMHAMARRPDDRFSTAEEFAEALEAASRSSAVHPAKPKFVGAFVRELQPRIEEALGAPATATPPSIRSVSQVLAEAPVKAQLFTTEEPSGPQPGSGLTNAAAVLSMVPQRSRHRLIAIVAGSILLGAVGAVLLMSYGGSQSAATPPAPAPTTAPAATTPKEETATEAEPPTPDPAPKTTPSVASDIPDRPPPPRSPRRPRPAPSAPAPKQSPTSFRPSGL